MRTTAMIACVIVCLAAGCHHSANAAKKPEQTGDLTIAGGRVEAKFDKPVVEVTDVARAVLLEHKLVLVQYSSNAKAGRVVAYTHESQRIEVTVQPDGEGSRVLISTEGNGGERISTDLLQLIRKRS